MPPNLLRAALESLLTWGPERMTPELDRLKEKQPRASEEERNGALWAAYQVLSAAEALAPEIKNGSANATAQLQEARHPTRTLLHRRDTGL